MCLWRSLGLISCLLMVITAWAEITPERQQALRYLVRQDCGACHGLTLKGGLGPALTPDALANRSEELLINSILQGRPGTAMPPWQEMISREEAEWIVDQLRQGLSPSMNHVNH